MTVIDTNTEEGKAELQKLIDNATEGLKNKNSELLAEVKDQKAANKSFQDQLDELKAAKEAADEEAANKSGDVEKIKANLETKHQKEREALMSELKGKNSMLHTMLVDNGLTEALSKAGVAPQYMDAAKALIQKNNAAEVTEVDGAAVARIGNESISDFVKGWSQGDQGKHFVAAPANGGGGAGGSNGGGKAPSGKSWMEMNNQEKTEYLKQNKEK
ncbi:MAG: hypothetical protein CMM93_02320 [Rickettsiales bacterium]|nr:hypothetical protein [Rickettsiales bacterium]